MGLDRLGLIKSTLLDFPGRVAATVFTAGCPLACPYCHNSELIDGSYPPSFISQEEIISFLKKRKNLLGGVAISGGEPLIHKELSLLLNRIADLGYQIKLDTSGVFPWALEEFLEHPALVYVALDIKTWISNYQRVGGESSTGKKVLESLELLRKWKAAVQEPGLREYEVRTVLDPKIVDSEDLKKITLLLRSNETWSRTPVKEKVTAILKE